MINENLKLLSCVNLILKRKAAFTLAEVLITLGVIGVVAAITLPAMIHNYKKYVIETRLKAITSTFMQAFKMAEAEYGDISTWDVSSTSLEFWKKYVLSYMSGVTIGKKTELSNYGYKTPILYTDGSVYRALDSKYTRAYLKNGAQMNFNYGYATKENGEKVMFQFWTTIDINGSKGPNILGIDNFDLVKTVDYRQPMLDGADMIINKHYEPDTYELSYDKYTEDELYEQCETKGTTCGGIIQRNGWKIPDNYPIKF